MQQKKEKKYFHTSFLKLQKVFPAQKLQNNIPRKKKSSVLMFYACFRTVVTIRKNL